MKPSWLKKRLLPIMEEGQPIPVHDDIRPDPRSEIGGQAESILLSAMASANKEPAPEPNELLGAVGQQNEQIRVRIASMIERLDEINSLREDFSQLAEPVVAILSEFTQLKSKVLEVEVSLGRERDNSLALRRELEDVNAANAKYGADVSALRTQKQKFESIVRDQEIVVEELRLKYRDKELLVSDLEKRLSAEVERARALSDANQALRDEAYAADQTAARLERELSEARAQVDILDYDNKSLRKTVEDQAQKISGLSSRYSELEQQFEASRQQSAEVEGKLANELALRQKIESQREAERSSHHVELSSLNIKIEGLTARLTATEKILTHTRDQLREKNEALRTADRTAKEAVLEKNALQRRFDATQQELERHSQQFSDFDKSRVDLIERSEMLVKAIGAKDMLLEEAETKNANLLSRIDELKKRFEQERAAAEAQNRKLAEDLQNERAERALAQGALEVARQSRANIQRQFSSLRRRNRAGTDVVEISDDDVSLIEDFEEDKDLDSNVRRLRTIDPDHRP